jgi:riboflavin biosynthesis pyrimidine reductase
MTKAGAHAMDLMVKKDGKPFFKVTYTVSADGKSLTESGGATATNEKVKIVYDRQ